MGCAKADQPAFSGLVSTMPQHYLGVTVECRLKLRGEFGKRHCQIGDGDRLRDPIDTPDYESSVALKRTIASGWSTTLPQLQGPINSPARCQSDHSRLIESAAYSQGNVRRFELILTSREIGSAPTHLPKCGRADTGPTQVVRCQFGNAIG